MLVYEYMNRFPIIIYASEAQTKTRFGYLDKICKRQFHKDYMWKKHFIQLKSKQKLDFQKKDKAKIKQKHEASIFSFSTCTFCKTYY